LENLLEPLKLISLNQALKLIKENVNPCHIEEIPLIESFKRVASEEIRAEKDLPNSPLAALDGFAVKSEDLKDASRDKPVRLKIKDKGDKISSGECLEVYTGKVLPEGSDAVVKYENSRIFKGFVEFVKSIEKGKNVVKVGEKVKKGDIIVKEGERVKAEEVALLLELGIKKIKVYGKPKVTLLAVGDDLYEGFQNRGIEAINYSYIISKYLENLNLDYFLDVSPDKEDILVEKILLALRKSDAIFTLAGCSIGKNDIVSRVIRNLGQLIFHGVRFNPIKVSGFAKVKEKPILMLPGQVVSMVSAFYLLGKPLIHQLLGLKEEKNFPIFAKCSSELNIKMESLIFVKLERKNGEYFFKPFPWGTDAIKNLIFADGYILTEENLKEGKVYPVWPFP